MPGSSNPLYMKKTENKDCKTYKYNDSSIDSKEQVRDLGIMMSNTTTFIESGKTEKLIFELDKFLELIPGLPKMTNQVTAARSNSILDQLSHRRALGI